MAEVPTQPGDRVVLRLEQPGLLTLTGTVFLLPAGALVVGLILGGYLTQGSTARAWRDVVQAALGLGAMAVAFFGLYLYDRSLRARRRRRPPRIVRVLEREAASTGS